MRNPDFRLISKHLLGSGAPLEILDALERLEFRYAKLKAQNLVYMIALDKQPIINVYYDKPKK